MASEHEARPLEVLAAERVLGWAVAMDIDGQWTATEAPGRWFKIEPLLNSWPGLGLAVEAMGCGFVLDYTPSQDLPWEMTFMPLEGDMGVAEAAQPWTAAQLAALRALGVDEEEIARAVEVSDG